MHTKNARKPTKKKPKWYNTRPTAQSKKENAKEKKSPRAHTRKPRHAMPRAMQCLISLFSSIIIKKSQALQPPKFPRKLHPCPLPFPRCALSLSHSSIEEQKKNARGSLPYLFGLSIDRSKECLIRSCRMPYAVYCCDCERPRFCLACEIGK